MEGWEYAPLFRLQFHALERKVDMVRRRRWRRRLVPAQPGGAPPTPRLVVKAGDGRVLTSLNILEKNVFSLKGLQNYDYYSL